ncbi:MAG: HD domain-containing phosphohydrolase [Planctomycetota bacterium]
MTITANKQSATARELDALNAGLLGLQAALLGRQVYDSDHAMIEQQLVTGVDALRSACDAAGTVQVLRVEDRVVYNGQRLPDSEKLREGLFAALSQRGVDGLTIRPGVNADQAREFLKRLAEDPTDADPQRLASVALTPVFLRGNPHGERATGAEAFAAFNNAEDVRSSAESFGSIWERVARAEGDGLGDDADALAHLVDQIAVAVRHGGAGAMLPMAELKRHDEYTYIHTVNVGIMAAGLAEAVGLNASVVRDITISALLHDVGKKQTPLEVLNKSGKLEDHELRIMRNHPVDGAKILFDTPGVPEIAPIIAYEHHIHRDGTGYPQVRPGYVPHLGSQITQLADVFDALRTHRPYRKAMPLPKVLEIMGENGGEKYDRQLLAVFFDRVVIRSSRDGDAA